MENFLKHPSVLDFLLNLEAKYGDRVSHSLKVKNEWINYTYKESIGSAFNLMRTLETAGIGPGDRLLIIARNRPEFCFSFFACTLLGAVAIPIDPRMNIKDLHFIYEHSGPKAIITLMSEDNSLARAIAGENEKVCIVESSFSTNEWMSGTLMPERRSFNPDAPALIIYTSGTTQRPKGVVLSYNNLFSQVDTIANDTFELKDDLRYLSILPLNHLFEFTTGLIIPFCMGGEVCYGHSLLPSAIIESLKEKNIREMMCVPLFLKMFKKGIEAKMNEKFFLRHYFKLGIFCTSFIRNQFFGKIYFMPIHLSFGGELRRFISGGAILERDVEEFFNQLGFAVYQGYGLTETSPIATVNTHKKIQKGSVGTAIKGVQVKVDRETGEILIKGPNVMKGYYRDQELTDEVIDREGWFHTGDVGIINDQGFLTITGRIKELIVLPSGKKVVPHDVETELMKDNPFLKEVCVVGMKSIAGSMKGREEVCAVVVPADNYIHLEDKVIHELLKECLKGISDYKRPSRIIVQRHELEKTSTLKVKRISIKRRLEIADQNSTSLEHSQYK